MSKEETKQVILSKFWQGACCKPFQVTIQCNVE